LIKSSATGSTFSTFFTGSFAGSFLTVSFLGCSFFSTFFTLGFSSTTTSSVLVCWLSFALICLAGSGDQVFFGRSFEILDFQTFSYLF